MSLPFSVLSLNLWEKDPEDFSFQLGKNFQNTGFCGISDHTLNKDLVDEVLEIFKEFFSLPKNKKMAYFEPNLGGARGYTPIKIETPKDGYEADVKEFWQTGRNISIDDPYAKWMPQNKSVNEISEFNKKIDELFNEFDSLGQSLLQSIALFLDLEASYFETIANKGNSVMRSIHYPPVRIDDKGERSGAHEDINLITLLIGGNQPGLEIKSKDDEWISVDTAPEVLVCNIGDMLQRLTNHKLVSTTHRVNAPIESMDISRYSIPFFVHPNPDWLIETLDSCCTKDNPKKYMEPILAEDYLQERLKEIKLIS